MANKILADAGIAFVESVASTSHVVGTVYPVSFKPDSGLPTQTMRTTYGKKEVRQIDMVIVSEIEAGVCRILVRMNGSGGLTVLGVNENGTYDDFTACVETQNIMAFTWTNLVGTKYTCEMGCSENGYCDKDTNTCQCHMGFGVDKNGACQECDGEKDISQITSLDCCSLIIGAVWDAEKSVCACAGEQFFDGTACGGFCVYGYDPALGDGTYYSDCSYTYTIQEDGTVDRG